jgi:outer membrane protein OmpA-like peptidoglycan-associated protein
VDDGFTTRGIQGLRHRIPATKPCDDAPHSGTSDTALVLFLPAASAWPEVFGVMVSTDKVVTGMEGSRSRQIAIALSVLVAVLGLSFAVLAAVHVRGVVTGRATDGSLMVRTDDADIAVVLDENTKVRQTSGMRAIKVDVASLIPGLRVDVEGTYQSATRVLADRITFTRYDLKIARNIQAGLMPTNEALVSTRVLVDTNQQQNNLRFNQQQATLDQHDQRIAATDEKILATSGAIEGRISNLDDYTVVDTLTVYFRNGQYAISSDFKSRLRDLAQKAKSVDGYAIQIDGHASAVGSEARNQNLSGQRAAAVAAVLYQNGIPSTKMNVPAAMGVSDQVASNRTKEGQAQNRRAVVRVLQNRGITGN